MNANEPELRITLSAMERTRGWLDEQMRDHARHGVVTALVLVLFGLIANFVVFVSVLFLALHLVPHWFETELTLSALALLVLFLMYPAYIFGGRPGSRSFKLNRGTVTLAAEVYEPPEFLPGSEVVTRSWRPLVDYCTFPAWLLHKALRNAKAPLTAKRADTETMARVLLLLLRERRRLSIHDIEDAMPTPGMAAAINALVHVRGVLVFHADYPALGLNDELQQTLRAML